MTSHPAPVATYLSAIETFSSLVRRIPDGRWHGPGLGEWDLRALVGHASRSLITVRDYLPTTAAAEDIASPEGYYAHIAAASIDAAALIDRGRQAGADLGADPAAAVDRLAAEVAQALSGQEDKLISVIGGLGIRLYAYLPTRTFELAVHGLDIAPAAGVPLELPVDVLAETTALAARTAVALGSGPELLLALTGRAPLPASFTVV